MKELDRVVGRGRRSRDVALALSIASEAIELDRPEVALPLLSWAKHEAPRSPSIREALGVALYLDGQFDAAHSELAAYRRMSGRVDQNHVIADCLRASGRGLDRVAAAAHDLVVDERAPLERRAEAVLVVGGALADAGELAHARRLVTELLRGRRGRLVLASDGGAEPLAGFELVEEAEARALWLAAELAERDGDVDAAIGHLDRLLSLDPEFPEARERRDGLSRSA
jgi:tetratricopeptide (TPR) repeat protein